MRIDDRLFGVLICLLGIAILWISSGFPRVGEHFYGPAMFPSIIGWGFVVTGLLLSATTLRRPASFSGLISFPDWHGSPRGLASVVLMLVAIPAFIYLGDWIGFQILAFTTLFLLYLAAGRGVLVSAAIAFGVTLAFYLLFNKLLRVPLPNGVFTNFSWW
jgi:putative tricarboxylic transport membrane protein